MATLGETQFKVLDSVNEPNKPYVLITSDYGASTQLHPTPSPLTTHEYQATESRHSYHGALSPCRTPRDYTAAALGGQYTPVHTTNPSGVRARLGRES